MPTFKEDADAFRNGPSGFKMKYNKSNFPFKGDGRAESSAFQKKADGWRPHHTAETEVSSIERKQKRLDKRASKGKDVSGAQERLDKRSERVYDREIARAERKERKAAKKLEKGKGKQAARKKYKAGKIREAVSPLKASEYQGGIMPQTYGTVPSPSKKRTKGEMKANPDHGFAGQITSPMMKKKKTSPHETVKKLQAKKANGTITPPELKKLNKLMKEMDQFYKDQSAPSYRGNYDEID
tara:strand:+ start:666 stop:1385 length:720 start_codon:yes stop_codon:yes gene_type:complete